MSTLFRMDAARWLVPGDIGNPDEVSFRKAMFLLYRHMSLRAMLALRIGGWFGAHRIPGAPSFMQRLIFRRYGLEVAISSPIGGGLYVAHPVGTVLSASSMGENCSVIAAVTIGMRNEHAFPVLGDRVFLGAGCRVLGAIHLGDDVKVGANAVVLDDVEVKTSVAGIPAKPLGKR